MKKIWSVFLLTLGLFLFSGCAPYVGVLNADMLVKENKKVGIRTVLASGSKTSFKGESGYQDKRNVYYKCDMKIRLHAIATKALENGYPYFVVVYPKGSNKKPVAITSLSQSIHYCVAGYYDKKTDFLVDKCGHVGLGSGTPSSPKILEAYFYKKRNPIIAMWDAKKVLAEINPTLVNECWSGDKAAFNKFLKDYNEFGEDEID
jgi:hypothetical protein